MKVEVTQKEYIDQFDVGVNIDRENHKKNSLKTRKQKEETKQIKKSSTDSNSGYMIRDNTSSCI